MQQHSLHNIFCIFLCFKFCLLWQKNPILYILVPGTNFETWPLRSFRQCRFHLCTFYVSLYQALSILYQSKCCQMSSPKAKYIQEISAISFCLNVTFRLSHSRSPFHFVILWSPWSTCDLTFMNNFLQSDELFDGCMLWIIHLFTSPNTMQPPTHSSYKNIIQAASFFMWWLLILCEIWKTCSYSVFL